MALFCAGSATAASQLNAVQVTPREHSATVSLRTTGSFAHKEYRPDDHLVLIDLNGVTSDAAVQRTATLSSSVLKSYRLSSYTSASGSEVTRVEMVVGDGVSLEVLDKSDGLQIVLSSADAPKTMPVPAAAPTPSSAASPLPLTPSSKANKPSAPQVAKTAPDAHATAPVAPVSTATMHAQSAVPAVIRSVSVQRGHGTMDVVIEGPSNARAPFLLTNPDRLVLDFDNTTVRPSVKNVAVQGKDVLHVRVGHFQSEPPVIRVVIDLSGPRTFDVVKSASQITVRINSEPSPSQKASLNPVSAPALIAPAAVTSMPVTVDASVQPSPAVAAPPSNPSPAVMKLSSPVQTVHETVFNDPQVTPAQPVTAPSVAPETVFADLKAVPAKQTETEIATPAPKPVQPKPVHLTEVSLPAKPKPTEVVAPAPKPVIQAEVIVTVKPQPTVETPAPKPVHEAEVIVAPAPKPVQEAEVIVPVKPQPIEVVAPAPKPVIQAEVIVPVKPQPPVETPAPQKIEPAPAASVVPQVHDVQEKLASASTRTQPQEAIVTAPLPTPERHSVDPGARAGAAAGTLSTSTPSTETVEMARLTAPGQFPGGATAASTGAPKYTGEPISVNLKDVDLKDFFRLIHEISGLNIVLDPSVHGNVTLVLDDVPWDQALDIVLKNNALDRELQGNVLRIAATDTLRKEAVDRRAQSEAVALAVDRQTITRFLSYAKSAQVVPTIKKFLTARGDVIADERTNALIISDIPSVLPNLDRLISQLDRKSQEVEIEVRVVSATRSFSRDLGVQLGFNWGNGVSTIAGANPNGTTTTTTSTGTTTTTAPTSTVPLFTTFSAPGATTGFSISNITKSYGIDAVLTAAESHNLAKVLSRPRVVTQSNIKAEVKQGVKIPVYTQSTANANASVTYIDAVLRLSVTPQITADNTVFMTVDVENTQPSGSPLANGNFILTTQQASTQVLVSDGGTLVIGGVIQTTNSVSSSQTPLLGDIPWLGNLFKQRSVRTETDELIFFITPKIVVI
jgi:type IV pilus assembly protein PilQ